MTCNLTSVTGFRGVPGPEGPPGQFTGSMYLAPYTGAVERTLLSKIAESVSVKDFGAVGDGVTDDTAAIQTAFNTAKNVFLPEGTYFITDAITLPENAEVFGEGKSKSVLLADKTFNMSAEGILVVNSGCTVSHLGITCLQPDPQMSFTATTVAGSPIVEANITIPATMTDKGETFSTNNCWVSVPGMSLWTYAVSINGSTIELNSPALESVTTTISITPVVSLCNLVLYPPAIFQGDSERVTVENVRLSTPITGIAGNASSSTPGNNGGSKYIGVDSSALRRGIAVTYALDGIYIDKFHSFIFGIRSGTSGLSILWRSSENIGVEIGRVDGLYLTNSMFFRTKLVIGTATGKPFGEISNILFDSAAAFEMNKGTIVASNLIFTAASEPLRPGPSTGFLYMQGGTLSITNLDLSFAGGTYVRENAVMRISEPSPGTDPTIFRLIGGRLLNYARQTRTIALEGGDANISNCHFLISPSGYPYRSVGVIAHTGGRCIVNGCSATEKTVAPTWSATASYPATSVVRYNDGTSNVLYESKQAVTPGILPTDTDYWEKGTGAFITLGGSFNVITNNALVNWDYEFDSAYLNVVAGNTNARFDTNGLYVVGPTITKYLTHVQSGADPQVIAHGIASLKAKVLAMQAFAGLPYWSSATTYASGAKVSYGDFDFTSKQNGNTDNTPDPAVLETDWWLRGSVTRNRIVTITDYNDAHVRVSGAAAGDTINIVITHYV